MATNLPARVSTTVCNALSQAIGSKPCAAPPSTTANGGTTSPPPVAQHPLTLEDYRQQLCQELGLDCAHWDPSKGLSCNDQFITPVYDYYGRTFDQHPELQWAGMGKLAGGLLYAGWQDLHVLRALAKDERARALAKLGLPGPLVDVLANATAAQLDYFETKFVAMQKQIFEDLGVRHYAYLRGGIQEMRRLYDAGQISREELAAWEDVASGDPARIKRGNEAFLYREQKIILQSSYDAMKNHDGLLGLAVTYMIGLVSQSPIPGGKPFRDVVNQAQVPIPNVTLCVPFGPCWSSPDHIDIRLPVPTGNIATFDSRWKWITEDMLPAYQRLLDKDPKRIKAEIDRSLSSRVNQFRLIPLPYNPKDGVC